MKFKTDQHPGRGRRAAGLMLVECLVYATAGILLVGVAFAAFYRCVESSLTLRRNASDVSNALLAGERWRSDVRAASGRIVLSADVPDELLLRPGTDEQIAYHFATNAVWRRLGAGNWICAMTNVKSSTMRAEARAGVAAWRWELELLPRAKRPGSFRPLFTFLAAPERSAAR